MLQLQDVTGVIVHAYQQCISCVLIQGQWRGDVYHGEGSILHASGVTYKGMWVNGRPAGDVNFIV